MIIIGDIHGHYKTLKALVKKLPTNEKIVITGDLIDRGPNSRKVIQFVRENQIDCVMGNHEQMAAKSRTDYSLYKMWLQIGGKQTVDCYKKKAIDPEFKKDMNFLSHLPLYLEYQIEGAQDLLVSHSVMVPHLEIKETDFEAFEEAVLWYHFYSDKMNKHKKFFNVFGHTPSSSVRIYEGGACVDTGCYQTGWLSALQYPQMKIFRQKKVD